MTVTGYVNGKVVDKAMPLEVIRRRLQLEVLPGAAVRRGTSMSFRMFPDTAGGAAWTGVTWRISNSTAVSGSTCGAGKTACTETALKSYQRTALAVVDDSLQERTQDVEVFGKFEIIPDNAAPKLGDTVVFTAYLDDVPHAIPRWEWDGAPSGACGYAARCSRIMDSLGTHKMIGWTTAASGGESASATVTVRPLAKLLLTAVGTRGTAHDGGIVLGLLDSEIQYSIATDQSVPALDIVWDTDESTLSGMGERRTSRGLQTAAVAAYSWTSCADGSTTCADRPSSGYWRGVSATVDGVRQRVKVLVLIESSFDRDGFEVPEGWIEPPTTAADSGTSSDTTTDRLCRHTAPP